MTNPDTKFRANLQQVVPSDPEYVLNGNSLNGAAVSTQHLADQTLVRASRQLQGLAQTVRERGDQVALGGLATTTAGVLERGATYVQNINLAAVRNDLRAVIRRYPNVLLLIGLGLSFFLRRNKRR